MPCLPPRRDASGAGARRLYLRRHSCSKGLIAEHPRESDGKHQLIRSAAAILAFDETSRNPFDAAIVEAYTNGVARGDGNIGAHATLKRRSPPRTLVGVTQ